MKKRTSTFPLRLPASLKAAVAEISKEDGTSINQFVTTAVAEKTKSLTLCPTTCAHGSCASVS